MARSNFILRPSGDIHHDGGKWPSDSEAVYLLINEESPDDNVTYIRANNFCSQFYLAGEIPDCKFRVTGLTLYVRGNWEDPGGDEKYSISFLGGEYVFNLESPEINNWSTVSGSVGTDSEACVAINNYIKNNPGSFPEIVLNITPDGKEHSKGGFAALLITQVYLEVNYVSDIGLYKKVGGAVKAATAAYRKLGSSWVEIAEEETKDVLKNNIITEGKT